MYKCATARTCGTLIFQAGYDGGHRFINKNTLAGIPWLIVNFIVCQ